MEPASAACPGRHVHRHRFAGQRGHVEAGGAGPHDAVGRHPVAGAQLDPVARTQRRRRHRLDHAAAEPPRLRLGQPAERPDRLARAEQAALLQHVADDHDDRQHRRGHQVAARPGGDQHERDQPVGDAVQARRAQALPGRQQHRHRDQRRRRAGHQVGQCRAVGHGKFPSDGNQQQPGRQHGQRQPRAQQQPLRPRQQRRRQKAAHGSARAHGWGPPGRIRRLPPCGSTAVTWPAWRSTAAMRSR